MRLRLVIFLAAVIFPSAPVFGQLRLTLSESLLRAQANNETLLIAQQELQTAKQRIRESAADGLPQLDATIGYTRNWLLPNFVFGNQSVTIGAHNNLSGTIGIRQTLYSGGKLFAAIRAARIYRNYAQENIRHIAQQVHRDVESAFYSVLLSQDLLRVSKLSLTRARANLTRVQNLYRAGRVSEYDLLRAQTQVAEMRPDSIQAENNLKLARLQFKNQIGLSPETDIQTVGSFRLNSSVLSLNDQERVTMALSKRPDYRQQDYVMAMQEKAITVAQAASRPKLNLVINGQWEAQKDNLKFSASDFNQSWFSGLNLSIPLFDGFRTRSQVAQAKAETRRAELLYQQMQRHIQLEIAQAQQNLTEALARKEAQNQVKDLAQKGLKIAETRYANGVGTQLEVIDGQLTMQRAEAQMIRAEHDVAIAIIQLELSLGILGETDQQAP